MERGEMGVVMEWFEVELGQAVRDSNGPSLAVGDCSSLTGFLPTVLHAPCAPQAARPTRLTIASSWPMSRPRPSTRRTSGSLTTSPSSTSSALKSPFGMLPSCFATLLVPSLGGSVA